MSFMCNAAICDDLPTTPTTTTNATMTPTPEECAARGPGWAPSSLVQCDDEQIGTKIEDDGCARCLCNQPNTPSQGQSCKVGDFCQMYATCCGTAEITMYACHCDSANALICFAAVCAPC
jgi:hypothetical protein